MSINVNITGVPELAARLQSPDLIAAPLRRGLDRAGYIVESEAKILSPVDRGRLRASITHEVDPSTVPMFCRVGTNVQYARAVHDGRPPGSMPPMREIAGWAQRHGLPAWPVAVAIARNGTPAQPYLSPALERREREAISAIDDGLRGIQL